MAQPTSLITGVAGQDGVLLARHLLAAGHRVIGVRRPGPAPATSVYLPDVQVVEADVCDTPALLDVVRGEGVDRVFHLAASSSVAESWKQPEQTQEVNALSVERLLDGLLALPTPPRFVLTSSSEVFGPLEGLVDHTTPREPTNPYGEAKNRAHAATEAARERGLCASVAIMFNHESALRPARYVTRKIVQGAVDIAAGRRDRISLGTLTVERDWGDARDHVRALAALGELGTGDDVVVATGRLHRLRDVVESSFAAAGVDDPWAHIDHDPGLVRPVETRGTAGDPARAGELLGWKPELDFDRMLADMVRVETLRQESGVEHDPRYLEV